MTTHTPASLRAAALALALLPGLAHAQARRPSPRPIPPQAPAPVSTGPLERLEVGGSIGLAVPLETQIDTGLKLSAGAYYGLLNLASGVLVQVGGSLGYSHNAYGTGFDGSLHSFDLLPTGRVRALLVPRLFAGFDLGMGLGILRRDYVTLAVPNVPATTTRTTDAAFLLRLGGVLGYDVLPDLSITFEPAFHVYATSGSVTQFTMLFGALYRP